MKIAAYIASLLIGLWLFSGLTKVLEKQTLPAATTLFIKHRMLEFIEHQNEVFKDTKAALFFGASEIECCANPNLLNPLLKRNGMDLHAVNVGMRNVELEVYLAFVYQMVSYLKEHKQTIDTVFVKVPYTKLTERYRRYSRRNVIKADQMAAVLSYKNLWDSDEYFADFLPEILTDRKSTRLNSSHTDISRMPSSA